jgi:hypothetical protein
VPPLNPVPRCVTTGLPRWGHPSVRLRQDLPRSPKQCHPPVQRNSNMESPASSESRPGWGHPTNREADDRTVGATTQPGAKMCHDRTAKMGPPVSSSPTGSAEKPRTVPPASSECQKGATRQFGRSLGPPPKPLPEQCHPSVCLRQDRPESPKHCHPSATCQNSATRQFAER